MEDGIQEVIVPKAMVLSWLRMVWYPAGSHGAAYHHGYSTWLELCKFSWPMVAVDPIKSTKDAKDNALYLGVERLPEQDVHGLDCKAEHGPDQYECW